MKITPIFHKAFLLLLFALCVGRAFSFAASPEKMTLSEVLNEFDKADSKKQWLLANRLFDILNEEDFFDEPFSMPSNWSSDSVRAEVWLTATIYYFDKQQFREAVKYGNNALHLLIPGGDKTKITDCLSYLSASYARMSDYAKDRKSVV